MKVCYIFVPNESCKNHVKSKKNNNIPFSKNLKLLSNSLAKTNLIELISKIEHLYMQATQHM
jgi:hypothetical protein